MGRKETLSGGKFPIDSLRFRSILGHFPTGVVAVTSLDDAGNPVGMSVGSFTSVSLEPPLVAFLVDKKSTSFPKFSSSGAFCVNILSSSQAEICAAFAKQGADKFSEVSWSPSEVSHSPQLHNIVAWIDCKTEVIHDAGDHHIVVGRVSALGGIEEAMPLLFFKGSYGDFIPH